MRRRSNMKKAAYFCVILILVLVMVISGLRILESTVFRSGQVAQQPQTSKTVTKNGVNYFPRQDINVVLVMGIDQSGPVEKSKGYSNPGAADMVALLVFDEKNENCKVLYLNRDTMLEMPVLGIGGKQAGTFFGQLALSHTHGTGLEDSCENTKNTVSEFLGGITIDYYVAMHMDAIPVLNDAVGGVTVTVTDDFSLVDPTIVMGEMTLRGDQSIRFVRTRKGVGDQLNLSRIDRQKEYIDGFVTAYRAKREQDSQFLVSAYEQVSPYIVSDCSVNTVSAMMKRYAGYEIAALVTPEGENVLGNEYYEFYADEDKLQDLILELFYAPK